jgi:hypothetical protein
MKKMETQSPILFHEVIQMIGALLHQFFGTFVNFSIAGSYPASVIAADVKNVALKFNDMDVFVWFHDLPEKWKTEISESKKFYFSKNSKRKILTNLYLKETVFDTTVNIIILHNNVAQANDIQGTNHLLKAMVSDFDINAVQVGFDIYWDATYSLWKVSDAVITNLFYSFLENKILKIANIQSNPSPAASIIRLLYKSHQLKCKLELPPNTETLLLREIIHPKLATKWQEIPNTMKIMHGMGHFQLHGPIGPFTNLPSVQSFYYFSKMSI